MDNFDRNILRILQHDCTQPVSEVAAQVGLSTTPCWRRIQPMEKNGIIKSRVALADPEKLNFGLTVFVMIKTNQHNLDWLDDFSINSKAFPEIIEFNRFLYVISKKMCRVTSMAHFVIAHCLCHSKGIIFRVEFIILCFSTY